ncbi:DUF1232 domain-containing protein [Parabacteroides sp. OttesenSCG-928-N08]|nr:DUF1232 domain-containing protein [Parabacteroides sp. OttesenSCG-928-N08]
MKTPTNIPSYGTKYSESEFWSKIMKCCAKAGIKLVYVALLLYYALKSPNVSQKDKSIIIGALGYFILPLDVIPDFLPGGYADDLAALLWALKTIWDNITPDIKQSAKMKLSEWFGDYDNSELENLW